MLRSGTPNLAYTQPPIDIIMPAHAQDVFVFVTALLLFSFILIALYFAVRDKTGVPLLAAAGAVIAVIYEPVADNLMNALHPPVGQYNVFTTNGHPIPLHVVLVYPVYLLLPLLVLWNRIQRQDLTKRSVWKAAGAALLFAIALEQPIIHFGLWTYYGYHGLMLGYIPAWMVFVNVCGMLAPALLIYRFYPRMRGAGQLLAIPFMLAGLSAAHQGSAIFMSNVLGTDTTHAPQWWFHAALAATIAFCALFVWLMTELLIGAPSKQQTHGG